MLQHKRISFSFSLLVSESAANVFHSCSVAVACSVVVHLDAADIYFSLGLQCRRRLTLSSDGNRVIAWNWLRDKWFDMITTNFHMIALPMT